MVDGFLRGNERLGKGGIDRELLTVTVHMAEMLAMNKENDGYALGTPGLKAGSNRTLRS